MKPLKSLIAAAALGCIASANADLLYTFDSGPTGADGGAFTGGTFAWSSAYHAVQSTGASGGWNLGGAGPKFEFGWPAQTTMQTIANGGNGRVSFDLFVSANSSFSIGGWADWDWFQLHFAGNSDGAHGWTQDAGGPNPVDTNFHPTDSDRTWHFDMTFAQVGWEAGDAWFQLFLGANSDGAKPVQFYVDNIRVYEVPEPGTLALAGLAGAALLIFRRK
jgi:hypothetical protein